VSRRYDEAIEQLRTVLELEPNFGASHYFLGLVYTQQGKCDEALTSYKQAMTILGEIPEVIAHIGCAQAMAGRRDEARKILNQLLEMSPPQYVEPCFIAIIYTAPGDREQAFVWLEKGFDDLFASMADLKFTPMFDSLRDDPRFQSLLQRMGLAAASADE
jgi:adenylate cyclase